MIRFKASGAEIEVLLSGTEVAILSRLDDLVGSAGDKRDDPARERLFPAIYADDEAATREFQRLSQLERVRLSMADRERFAETLGQATSDTLVLSREDAAIWARVLGQARIILAARHGLFESGLPDDSPQNPDVALVMLLGYLLQDLAGEMLKTMEDAS